jgi:hypothetical protein
LWLGAGGACEPGRPGGAGAPTGGGGGPPPAAGFSSELSTAELIDAIRAQM